MPRQDVEFCAVRGVPDDDAGVGRAGEQEVGGAEADAQHGLDEVGVAAVAAARGVRAGVPAPDGGVPAAGEEGEGVGAEGEAGEGGRGAVVDVRCGARLGGG